MKLRNNVNSIRPDGGTSLLGLCEVRSVAPASRTGKDFARGETGQRNQVRVLRETVNRRKAAASPVGGWRQNGRKRERGKQGDLSGDRTAFMARVARRTGPAGVRASVVARKRLTSVEPRDGGKWKRKAYDG